MTPEEYLANVADPEWTDFVRGAGSMYQKIVPALTLPH